MIYAYYSEDKQHPNWIVLNATLYRDKNKYENYIGKKFLQGLNTILYVQNIYASELNATEDVETILTVYNETKIILMQGPEITQKFHKHT